MGLLLNKNIYIFGLISVIVAYGGIKSYLRTRELENTLAELKNEIVFKEKLMNTIAKTNTDLNSKLEDLTTRTNNFVKENKNECVFSSKFIEQLNSNIKEINKWIHFHQYF